MKIELTEKTELNSMGEISKTYLIKKDGVVLQCICDDKERAERVYKLVCEGYGESKEVVLKETII